jgi:hypothetical protein
MRGIPAMKTNIYGEIPMNTRFLQRKVFLLLLAILVFLPGAVWSQQGTPVAVIIKINGKADIRVNDKAAWKPAKVMDKLWQGYQLRTETGNKAVINYLSTGSRVLVNENTQIEVQAQAGTIGGKPSKDRTRLLMGEIYSHVTKSNYEVETPSSVASVRGTQFDSKYDMDNGVATFLVLQSVVEVRDLMNQIGTVLLKQLQMTTVKKNEGPSNPTDLSRDEANNRTNWTRGVEPKWKLNMVPEGGTSHDIGTTFTLSLYLMDAKSGTLDSGASLNIGSFTASSDIIDFSTDKGKNWTPTPQIKITGGTASLLVRVKGEGTAEINASADNVEPAGSTITVTKAKSRKTIEINFADPDGKNPKTLYLELEEK